jgi:hypothetical protein
VRGRNEEFLLEDPGRVLRTAVRNPENNQKANNDCHDWGECNSAYYFGYARFDDEADNKKERTANCPEQEEERGKEE